MISSHTKLITAYFLILLDIIQSIILLFASKLRIRNKTYNTCTLFGLFGNKHVKYNLYLIYIVTRGKRKQQKKYINNTIYYYVMYVICPSYQKYNKCKFSVTVLLGYFVLSKIYAPMYVDEAISEYFQATFCINIIYVCRCFHV